MERNLLFYDHKMKKTCALFCKKLQIDYLPSCDGKFKFVYDFKRDTFDKQPIEENQRLHADQPIFDKKNIERFRNNEHQVLFVYEGEVLVGVVHVCDYNRDIVLETIQQWVLTFEQLLRKYLLLVGKTNEDLWEFLSQKPKPEAEYLNPFQSFYLLELMKYVKSDKVKLNLTEEEAETINKLRNRAMHGKDSISNKEFYYETSDLKKLLSSIETLQRVYHRVLKFTNDLRVPLIKEMNQKKLEFIQREGEKSLGLLLNY